MSLADTVTRRACSCPESECSSAADTLDILTTTYHLLYSTCGGTVLLRERDVLPMGVVTPVTYTHSPSGGVKELGAEVWTTPLTAEQWAMPLNR